MKAWLSNLLYPLNLWRYSLACCHWCLRVYQRWLWEPFLENWLANDPKAAKDKGPQSRFYTCVQCGRKKSMALVVFDDVQTSFFCSVMCRDKYSLCATSQLDSDELQKPSI
jgi:hypothetical protein